MSVNKNNKKCCKMGTYECQVPMPINGRVRYIDFCIADIVAALNAANIKTEASCCGHGKDNLLSSIILQDGDHIVIIDEPVNSKAWTKLWNAITPAIQKYKESNK